MKYYLSALFVSLIQAAFAVNITFQLDFSTVGVAAVPEVNGTFNGWCGNCNPMTDANGDNIWEVTIDLAPGYYEYKYSYNNWQGAENLTVGSSCTNTTDIFTNRTLNVSSAIVLAVVCWNSCSSCVEAPPVEWELCWSDEFDGNALDAAIWTPEIGGWGWGNNESQYYTSNTNNLNVSNGTLKITAVQENYNGSNYTSARIITNDKFEFQYGKVEARMKLPMGQGIWPAFWMLGANIETVGWPECGEIDIMEHINSETQTHGTMHWNNNGHAYLGGSTPVADPTQYHIYGVEWDAYKARFYVDNVFFYQFDYSNNANSQPIFTKPFFLLLNVAVGGNWPGYPDGSTVFPATMEVDYVRIYKEVVSGYACGSPIQVEANFSSDVSMLCEGEQVHFQNTSTGGATDFYWQFEGGSPAFSIDENPVVVYNSPGTFSVTLQASNSLTSDSYTSTNEISVSQNITWYEDADGDGFGNGSSSILDCVAPIGFVNIGGDCNDTNNQVYPGHTEVCGNAVDDDCDTSIDEGCTISLVVNDEFVNATTVTAVSYPYCINRTVNLANATPSAEATSEAPNGAGQDVWYAFIPSTNGARIMAQSTICDVVLELHDAAHNIYGVENETTSGQEIMVVGNLTPGEIYYLLVRNFSTSAVGSVITCIQNLVASSPDNGVSFDNLCGHIKCDWNGSQLYTVNLTSEIDQSVYSASHTGTLLPFQMFNGVAYNTSYSAVFISLYMLPDAVGNVSSFEVVSQPYTITIVNHPSVVLRAMDRCPTMKSIGSFIGADRWICGIMGYQWEFTLSDEFGSPLAIEPAIVDVNALSRYVRTSSIPGVQPGDKYLVRVRPIFSNGYGDFGDAFMLCIAGGAGLTVQDIERIYSPSEIELEPPILIYPNPNKGDFINVRFGNISSENVQIRVLDSMGRLVYTNQYAVSGTLNGVIVFDRILASGLYNVEVMDGEKVQTQKFLVVNQ